MRSYMAESYFKIGEREAHIRALRAEILAAQDSGSEVSSDDMVNATPELEAARLRFIGGMISIPIGLEQID
jgi:hypothetical protein